MANRTGATEAPPANSSGAAVLAGTHVLFTTAAQLLLDLGCQESTRARARRLHHYATRGKRQSWGRNRQ